MNVKRKWDDAEAKKLECLPFSNLIKSLMHFATLGSWLSGGVNLLRSDKIYAQFVGEVGSGKRSVG